MTLLVRSSDSWNRPRNDL